MPSAVGPLQAKLAADGKQVAALILEREKCQDHEAGDQVSGRQEGATTPTLRRENVREQPLEPKKMCAPNA